MFVGLILQGAEHLWRGAEHSLFALQLRMFGALQDQTPGLFSLGFSNAAASRVTDVVLVDYQLGLDLNQ